MILSMFQHPESPILHEQRNTRAVIDNKDLGTGTLYISERTLCWKEQGGLGFSIDYPHISMHAISNDPNVYPSECVFVVIDGHLSIPGEEVEVNEVDDDSDSEIDSSQLILVPPESATIHTIYNTLNQCQVLNPDPEDQFDENDDEDEEEQVYEDAENGEGIASDGNRLNDLGAGGDSDVTRLSARLHNHSLQTTNSYGNGDQNFDDDQFEDVD